MKVLFAASEATPFVKTDSFADFAGGLPPALHKLGVDVRVVLPLYEVISSGWRDRMTLVHSTTVALSWRQVYCGFYKLEENGITYYLVENDFYFKRTGIYGHFDDGERFSFFSRAVVELLLRLVWKPDIVHLNDWQTALVPIYLQELSEQYPFLKEIKSVFTIHNIGYQGRFSKDILGDVCGISESWFDNGTLEFMDNISMLKGAILTADRVTTVSPSYAEELRFPFYAKGLEGAISSISDHFYGILCGIDTNLYNPGTDPVIRYNYTSSEIEKKQKNKRFLQLLLNLDEAPDTAIIAYVGKLIYGKGIDLIIPTFERIMQQNVQFIVLGTGDYDYEKFFRNAEMQYKGRVSVNITSSDELARRIYAGGDFLLMPSQSEPCGRNQMAAMLYGMLPIVRETGGLKDTVGQYDPLTGDGNGFTFSDYNANDMLAAIDTAVRFFNSGSVHRNIMIRNNMKSDFSWRRTALQYIKLYKEM